MIAIVSDIQSNLEALTAVLADIEARGITELICLGNCVGWGPDPAKCLELAERFSIRLAGDFELHLAEFISREQRDRESDYLVDDPDQERNSRKPKGSEPGPIEDGERFAQIADQIGSERAMQFMDSRNCLARDGIVFALGSPLDYTNGRLSPDILFDRELADQVFSAFDHLFVCGHGHFPGVITQGNFYPAIRSEVLDDDGAEGALFADNQADEIRLRKNPAIINCGSLAPCSSGDARAHYLILKKHFPFQSVDVEFVDVAFDVATYRRKMAQI